MPAASPSASPESETKVRIQPESLRRALRIFRYLAPYRIRFVGAVVALLVSTAIGLSFPYLTGLLLDASMAKAVWLQLGEKTVNPYYGSSMLTCGKSFDNGVCASVRRFCAMAGSLVTPYAKFWIDGTKRDTT